MIGRVTAQREAMIELHVKAPRGQPQTVTAVVDTGFSECLALSRHTIASLRLPARGLQSAVLADGTEATLPVYWAVVQWHGAQRLVPALEIEGGALLGMALLHGSRLSMDVLEDGEVQIEPLSQA